MARSSARPPTSRPNGRRTPVLVTVGRCGRLCGRMYRPIARVDALLEARRREFRRAIDTVRGDVPRAGDEEDDLRLLPLRQAARRCERRPGAGVRRGQDADRKRPRATVSVRTARSQLSPREISSASMDSAYRGWK